jgi:hypothetical protein
MSAKKAYPLALAAAICSLVGTGLVLYAAAPGAAGFRVWCVLISILLFANAFKLYRAQKGDN